MTERVKVVCRCDRNEGRLCDPCAQAQFEKLYSKCQSDPECKPYEIDAPRKTGREGYRKSVSASDDATTAVDEATEAKTYRQISDRLDFYLDPEKGDERIKALADKLNSDI